MPKCPHCGSITVEEYEAEYFEDSPNEVLVVRYYFCGGGCGLSYTGTTVYKKDGEEELEVR